MTNINLNARAEIERIWKQTVWAARGVAAPAELVVSTAEWDFYEALLSAKPAASGAAPTTVNHIDEVDLERLRKINERLFNDPSLSGDARRDLANAMHVILHRVETADITVSIGADLKAIQDALGTAETGAGLVEVARNAHAAERARAGDTYNGWPNYETWLAYTWITNDQGVYFKARAEAKAAESDYAAGDLLKEHLPEWLDFPVTGLAADYVNAGMSRVDWMRIAESLRAD